MDIIDWQGILLLLVVFVPLERMLSLHPGQKMFRKAWWNDLIYLFANGWLIKTGFVLLAFGAIVASEHVIPASWREAVASQPIWLQTVEVLVIADVGFYFIHRAFHAVPWLWQFHAVHHSIEEMDWLAAHRVHPFDQILTKCASMVPCFMLGFSDVALGIYVFIYHWHSVLLHANVKIPFGPLRWLVASPEFHHWHHGDQHDAYDRNFAGQLALLDVLFGTAHVTKGTMPDRYGCSDPVPRTYWEQMLFPFRRWTGRGAGTAVAVPEEAGPVAGPPLQGQGVAGQKILGTSL